MTDKPPRRPPAPPTAGRPAGAQRPQAASGPRPPAGRRDEASRQAPRGLDWFQAPPEGEAVPVASPAPGRVPGGVLASDRPVGLYLNCAAGVESLLAAEALRVLDGAAEVTESRGGIEVRAPASAVTPEAQRASLIDAAMRLNLESRLAQRVLWRVATRVYRHEDDIYALGRLVNWSDWITPQHTLRVDVTSRRSHLRSLNFAALRIKDAVCDDLRERTGERPSVDTRFPDLGLVLYMDDMEATLYVDTSGEALFKRGWREDTGEAPLKETLAAAMIAAAGWQGRPEDGALLDPCCGAGTIPIEAAQIACGIAPGLMRRFSFERLLPFRPYLNAWHDIKQAARARQHAPQVPIYAGDVSFRMTDFATRNAERAGVLHAIEFKTADALQRPAPCERGVLMFNPPYGERIDIKGAAGGTYRARAESEERDDGGDGMARPGAHGVRSGRELFEGDEEAADFFQRLSSHWKKTHTGWTAWILSPDMKLPSAMRLKESRRVVLFNGPIECRLFRFDLVAGSNKRVPASAALAGPEPTPSDLPHSPDPAA